jgi:hypothetical protein
MLRPTIIIASSHSNEPTKLDQLRQSGISEIVNIEDIWNKACSKATGPIDDSPLFLRDDYETHPVAIFYTPGPIGPIGVRFSNEAVWNRVFWEWEAFPYGSDELMVHQIPPYEVQSVGELFTPLLAGKCILIMDPLHMDHFLHSVRSHKVTRMVVYPSLLVRDWLIEKKLKCTVKLT